jgi:hypothetical protein
MFAWSSKPSAPASVALGDSPKDWLHGANAQRLGEQGGIGCQQASRASTDMTAMLRALQREAGRQDLAEGVCVFCGGVARPPVKDMIAFIDDHRSIDGVEPICNVLLIAPSIHQDHLAKRRSFETV